MKIKTVPAPISLMIGAGFLSNKKKP